MNQQEKDITIHMQLNNICNLVNGTWKHTTIVHSNGKREEKFVISYPYVDASGSDSSNT